MAAQNAPSTTPQAASSASTLPNLNQAGQYQWGLVQQLVDRAACVNMFAIPLKWGPPGRVEGAKLKGGTFDAALHRFKVVMDEPNAESGVRASNTIGQREGQLHLRWSLIPDDFEARPGREPAATSLDPLHSQRFVMQEATFKLGRGDDSFSSFGTGRIFPAFRDGKIRLRAAACGNIMEGSGRFKGREGNYIFLGDVTDRGELVGNFLLRVVDPDNVFRTTNPLPEFKPADSPDPRTFVPDLTYILFRTEKSGPEETTSYNLGPDGQIRGVNVPQQYRLPKIDFSTETPTGLLTRIELGPVIGGEISMSAIDPTHPGPPGTADAPSPFQGIGTYFFRDQGGIDIAGFTPQFVEGRTFAMQLAGAPGQPSVRFGCFGPVLEGDGYFAGIQGLLAAVSGVAIMPHLFSLMQMLCLEDPDGKFRAEMKQKECD